MNISIFDLSTLVSTNIKNSSQIAKESLEGETLCTEFHYWMLLEWLSRLILVQHYFSQIGKEIEAAQILVDMMRNTTLYYIQKQLRRDGKCCHQNCHQNRQRLQYLHTHFSLWLQRNLQI